MADKLAERLLVWRSDDTERGLLWGLFGLGLLAASIAAGAATLFGAALLAGGVIAGFKAVGAIERAGRTEEHIGNREALRDARQAAAMPAPEVPAPVPPEPENAKSWTAAVTEKTAPETAQAAGRGA